MRETSLADHIVRNVPGAMEGNAAHEENSGPLGIPVDHSFPHFNGLDVIASHSI